MGWCRAALILKGNCWIQEEYGSRINRVMWLIQERGSTVRWSNEAGMYLGIQRIQEKAGLGSHPEAGGSACGIVKHIIFVTRVC